MQNTNDPPLSNRAKRIADLYSEGISNEEAEAAADRLVDFFRLLEEIDSCIEANNKSTE